MRLAGKTAVVTGAAQGLGFAVAKRFVAEGARVVVADLNGDKAAKTAASLSADASAAIPCAVNVGEEAEVNAMVALALAKFGSVDILVNNAGGAGRVPGLDIEDTPPDAWDSVIRQNLRGTFLCCRAAIPHMKTRRFGRIINISSGLATGRGPLQATGGATLAYAAAKAGILGFTYTLAKTVARYNIMANAVLPGFMLTEPGANVRNWFDSLPEKGRQALLDRSPMGRAGDPAELASLAVFLGSDECSYVTGAALEIHGAG